MTKVSLTLGEAKTKTDLTLEQKKSTTTWVDTSPGTWGDATRTWGQSGEFSTKETKTKDNLSLETK